MGAAPPHPATLGAAPPRTASLGAAPPHPALLGAAPPRPALLGAAPPHPASLGAAPPHPALLDACRCCPTITLNRGLCQDDRGINAIKFYPNIPYKSQIFSPANSTDFLLAVTAGVGDLLLPAVAKVSKNTAPSELSEKLRGVLFLPLMPVGALLRAPQESAGIRQCLLLLK